MTARRAYAKINLALSVGPPLPAGEPQAGMHPIATWMHCIDLWDEVEVKPGGAGLEVEWAGDALRASPIDWPAEKDLAVRAVEVLGRQVERRLDAAVRVVKRIPVGGGLGGGSADAAAAILAANEAFGLGLPLARLRELSRAVGSDVAFFLDEETPARPALVAGLGERITRVPRVAGRVVLVVPSFGCDTGAVYRAYDGIGPRGLREADVELLARSRRPEGADLFNDLRGPAEAVRPELRELSARVGRAIDLQVCMSGSGSTLFVWTETAGESKRLEEALRNAAPEATVVTVRLV